MVFDITDMMNPEVYRHPVKNIELIETHISWIILTGDFAYKIKKPVDFGFLNFSTLEKRLNYCKQELHLNRRLAPSIYLEVVPITETKNKIQISGDGNTVEYAVRMSQFPQAAQLDNLLAAGELTPDHMDSIAIMVAEFHQKTKISDGATDYGSNDMIYQPVTENFTQINKYFDTQPYKQKLTTLNHWCSSTFTKLQPVFEQRKLNGFIRECHGDMHLRNLVWLDGKPVAFDCIEFNANLRWIDVISEIAFLIMDLQDRKQQNLAHRFLNRYLELTGDYAGLRILPFYLCYRAMVRAKVNALRLKQNNASTEERKNSVEEFESYLELAIRVSQRHTNQPAPKLIIMRGMSASGKSTVSQQLLDVIGAIRIRSDIERKRLFGITPTKNASAKIENGMNSGINNGIYSDDASKQTYAKLIELSSMIIKAGYSVIVDAAFLDFESRTPFQELANRLHVPYIILETKTSNNILRKRIIARKNDVSDADLTVLEHQISNWTPLHESERKTSFTVDTTKTPDIYKLVKQLNVQSNSFQQ